MMGISLEEYIAGRQACASCENTGQQDFCTTSLLSREDSCIFYNALLKNSDPLDDSDVLLMQQFRSQTPEQFVLDYYVRSSKIVREINKNQGDMTKFWTDITDKYVRSIMQDIRTNDFESAKSKILTMLLELEI